ncbi:immunoglobulin-like domain-containing protein [uncultured Dysgonomonas sp.]|nr:immunoglobulin-like domain-containing protein [uncultured Dysgonomonas sp.]
MKILYKYSLIIASLFFLLSCDKDTEDVSRITEYASFEMQGDNFMYILANSTFTEPGVKATESGVEIPVETKGTVNTAVPDVYAIQYSATNSDGFPASVLRRVAVVPAIPTTDLSGEYQLVHATRKNKITITRVDGFLGYYHATDSWWQTYAIALDFVDMGDGTIKILPGSSPYGAHYGTGNILPDGQIQFVVTLPNQGNMTYSTTYKLQ